MRTVFFAFMAILLAGCGSKGGGTDDTGTDTLPDTVEDTSEDTATDTPLDTAEDTATDTPLDTAEDTAEDGAEDTTEDTVVDPVMDPDFDAEADVGDDPALDIVDEDTSMLTVDVTGATFVLDPYDAAPLVAIVMFTETGLDPADLVSMEVTVEGMAPWFEDLTAVLDPQSVEFQTNFDMSDQLSTDEVGIPVLGLYPDAANTVTFSARTATTIYRGSVVITTDPIADLAGTTITVDLHNPARMQPGWTYVNDTIFDHHGIPRWKGMLIHQVLRNGNILSRVKEYNWLGRNITTWTPPTGMTWHHDSIELPNGNIVECVHNNATDVIAAGGSTVQSKADYIIEVDRVTGDVVNAWDLREYLDVDRGTVIAKDEDWLHMNTLAYDEVDDAILTSGRYQGIIKLTRNGLNGTVANAGKNMVWILGPHLDWGLAGWDGTGPIDPNSYLLTAVDSLGVAYGADVQDNLAAPSPSLDDFHWNTGQHGIEVISHSAGVLTFLTFVNQASVIYDGPGTVNNGVSHTLEGDTSNDRSTEKYSAIIEYEIDESTMTVSQKWIYGELLPDLYGSYRCGVNYDPDTGNRMMISAGVDQRDAVANPENWHLVEVAEDGEVLYHLDIDGIDVTSYRGGRIDFYHPEP